MLCMTLLVSGCVKATECDWASPIRPSQSDVLTTATARQILAHNETGERLCGWAP